MGILGYGAIQVLMAFHSSNFTGAPCHRGASEASRLSILLDLQGSGKAARDDRRTPDNYRNSRLISTITLAQLLSSALLLRVVRLSVEVQELQFDDRCSA